MGRWIGRHRRAYQLAVSLLILALLPTPWPRVEFHNVRHHDAPGQVCEYHDHLLRWHPDARGAEDVAVLHWHWAWPAPGGSDGNHDGVGPRLHAHSDPTALPAVDPGATVTADTASRGVVAATAPAVLSWWTSPLHYLALVPPRPAIPTLVIWHAACASRASLTARLHRWTC